LRFFKKEYASLTDQLHTALDAAEASGAILRHYFRSSLKADSKTDESPVTIADREAEQAIRDVIAAQFPGHDIIGEEFGQQSTGADYCWVLDPLDGTRAFITGRPSFGTLIALLHHGVPVLGIIDQPVTGERWIGLAGEPTRFSGPFGGRVGASVCTDIAAAELSSTSPEALGAQFSAWQCLAGRARRVSWGGDCYLYGLLALGHIDLVAESNMKLWDYAALVPVVQGAGGRITDWSGRALGPHSDGTVLAAATPALHGQALACLA
jgi:myo-inositol-1(or 4)-monophosphatase